MKRTLVILFLVLGYVFQTFSQDVFTVVSSKNVVVKQGNSWNNLAVGSKLGAADKIKANKDGAASLLHSSGKLIKFTTTSETSISEFAKTVTPPAVQGSIAGQLAAGFNKSMSNKSAAAPAGATRATESVTKDIFLITPRRGTKVMDQFPMFVWNKIQGESEYQLSILTEDVQPIKVVTVKDTVYQYSKDDPALEKGVTYVCLVKPSKSPKQSEFQMFTIANDKEFAAMKERLDATNELVADGDETAKCVILGTTYEDLGLYSDAFFSYRKAIQLDPKEKAYRKMLAELLWKVNLIKQTSYLSGYQPEKTK